ncbi:hypothetical protein [Nocardioides sp. URHA0032]|uniref:hypothetical protein n=1 Tax=Nocardioides sp. URHA0032 TaxID=1380388 RepID=UPI00048F00AB|nr:hypothetical protein [Nocardioides sp. URHA0032]
MTDPTALDYWTLAIAVVGALTGIAALCAQVWAHVLSGPRVKVGLANSLPVTPSGPSRWLLSIEASNVGRLPVTVTSFGVSFREGRKWKNMPGFHPPQALMHGPSGAHRLNDAEAVTWLLDPVPFAKTISDVGVRNVYGFVNLATGKTIRSRKSFDLVNLASLEGLH